MFFEAFAANLGQFIGGVSRGHGGVTADCLFPEISAARGAGDV